MSRYVNVSGDYKLTVANGGTITLDTGSGNVYVIGNLHVTGDTTTVNTVNTVIKDNIITLNNGEQGAGISNNTAGIEIDRGSYPNAQFLFDEDINWTDSSNSSRTGAFILKTKDNDNDNAPVGLQTDAIITNGGNLNLIGNGTGVVSVKGTANYESNIGDPDDIPNIAWVQSHPTSRIENKDSKLELIDTDDSTPSFLQLTLDNIITAEFRESAVTLQGLEFTGTTVTGASNLTLAASNGIIVDKVLNILTSVTPPDPSVDGVQLYTTSESIAGTGIYFVNTTNTRDELISRRQALAYSMIF